MDEYLLEILLEGLKVISDLLKSGGGKESEENIVPMIIKTTKI